MRFFNKYIDRIYRYIELRDGQTILIKDIAEDLDTTVVTVRKYLKWLTKRKLIKKTGKRFEIVNQFTEED